MIAMGSGWKVVAVSDVEARHWASGVVKEVADLYRPDIFGPRRNYRCECGKRSGEDALDTPCSECGVWVVEDAAKLRRRRTGVLPLACPRDRVQRTALTCDALLRRSANLLDDAGITGPLMRTLPAARLRAGNRVYSPSAE